MEHTRISHYQLGARLGRGGMGEVYEAVDLDLDRKVALKFVAPELASDGEALRRFEREARSAAALSHPAIATVYAFERDRGQSFIAMELMSGESLRDRMVREPLSLRAALAVARDVASGLAHAHRRGVAHRDIKPENVMFDLDGAAKITDFGLAKAAQASRLTMTGSSLGTAAYMAPESLRGESGPAGDVFALGAMLHELIAGSLPFAGDNPLALMYTIANEPAKPLRTLRPDVPEPVESLVLRLLDKDPAVRPDATTALRELSALLGEPMPELAPVAPRTPSGVTADSGVRTAALPGDALVPATRTEELDAERVGERGERALVETAPASRTPWPQRIGIAVWALIVVAGVVFFGVQLLGRGGGRPPVPPATPVDAAARARANTLNTQGIQLEPRDAAGARALFEQALAADSTFPSARVNVGRLIQAENPERARALFAGVTAMRNADSASAAGAHYYLGLAELDVRNYAGAIEHLRRSRELGPREWRHASALGYALVLNGNAAEALQVLSAASAQAPDEPVLRKNAGLAHLRAGALPAAIAALDEAIRLDPRLMPAVALRAEAHTRAGDAARAATDRSTLARLEQQGLGRVFEAELNELRAARFIE